MISYSKTIVVLKKRSAFLSVAAHRTKWVTPAFIMQVAPRPMREGEAANLCGLGLTSSKKMIGNAVARNRARRRLRPLAREVLTAQGKTGIDYVLIARSDILTRDYDALRKDMQWALKRLNMVEEGGK